MSRPSTPATESLGEALKRAGLARVESRDPVLAAVLRAEARRLAKLNGSVIIDEIRYFAEYHKLRVPSPSFWGCIFKGPGWRIIGYETSKRPEKHGHRQPRWGLA